jgi:hypothetical protein
MEMSAKRIIYGPTITIVLRESTDYPELSLSSPEAFTKIIKIQLKSTALSCRQGTGQLSSAQIAPA